MDKYKTIDYKRAHDVGKYIDDNYLSKQEKVKFTRITQPELDMEGVDVIVRSGQTIMCVDEKCTMEYGDKELNTGLFELLSTVKDKDNYTLGWFLHNGYTTHYLFEYITGTTDNITGCELIMIPKEKIYNYLKEKGWNGRKLLDTALELVETNEKYIIRDGLKFRRCWTKDKRNGVGILLWRDDLRNIANMNAII